MLTISHLNKVVLSAFLTLSCTQIIAANDDLLLVISSADPGSKVAQSFVVVETGKMIPEGIKNSAKQGLLNLQIPFIIKLKKTPAKHLKIQWKVSIPNQNNGSIKVLSKFTGKLIRQQKNHIWQSHMLDSNIHERHQLVFRPDKTMHQPSIYKKGRGRNNQRQKYGGGTRKINNEQFNPRLRYEISVILLNDNQLESSHQTVIEMDNKDLIRQEYINHYNIKRYGRGDNGNLPVPKRSEITELPERIKNLTGNPLTESKYGLLVNDGMQELAENIVAIYEEKKQYYRKKPMVDLNGKVLPIISSKLWLSGGWRNPERNEWYSNALNGMHQRGGAIDIIVQSPPGHPKTAMAYWILWQGLEQNKNRVNAFWQLETNGRPMRTDEFKNDIEPANGIPDAFDKADHLHANIKYKPK